jgi:acyl-CoA thioesterase I
MFAAPAHIALAMLALLFVAAACGPAAEPARPDLSTVLETDPLVILYLGDSLTAGYGLPGEQAYPALLQQEIEGRGWAARSVNAGLSGDTSEGGLRRVERLLRQEEPDVLVVALGANDALRGLPIDRLHRNLEAIIDRARVANPEIRIVLAGLRVPTGIGGTYGARLTQVYADVARMKQVTLVPDLLRGVAGNRQLNLIDGLHPNQAGQATMAANLWPTLEAVLVEVRGEMAR